VGGYDDQDKQKMDDFEWLLIWVNHRMRQLRPRDRDRRKPSPPSKPKPPPKRLKPATFDDITGEE